MHARPDRRPHEIARVARARRSSSLGSHVLAIVAAALVATAATATAQLPLRVRAETRIELGVTNDANAVVLRGTLRDDLGAPLAQRRIDVSVATVAGGASIGHVVVHTDDAGSFEARFDAAPAAALVRAEFAGDVYHDGTDAAREVRPGLEDVRLALTVPGQGVFDLDARRHPITIVARAESGPAPVRVELLDELGRKLGEGVANELGRLRIELTPELLGPVGAGRLVARSAADARYAASQIEVPILRLRPTHLELRAARIAREDVPSGAARLEARRGARVVLAGRLYAADGGRRGEAIGIYVDGGHVATVLSDEHGAFEVEATMPATDAESIAFSARYAPNGPGLGPSASAPVVVHALGEAPYRWAHRLLPPLALLAVFAVARSVARARRRIAARPAAQKAPEAARERFFGARVSAIEGVVLGERDVPLASARVRVTHAGGAIDLVTDGDGRFAIGELPRGDVEIAASAPGHAGETLRRTLPARPRDAAIVLRLASLRAVALAAYRRVAEGWLESPDAWPTTTNPRAADLAPLSTREQAAELAASVDRVYYGPPPADAGEVDRILRSAEEQRNNAEPLHRTR